MKQKKFKIEGTTLFVYRPQNNKTGRNAMPTDPTSVTTTTSVSTDFSPR